MMTPEERAKLLIGISTTPSSLEALISEAIRIAVEEEREAIIGIIKLQTDPKAYSVNIPDDIGETLVEMIRERGR